jgi:transcriptional regulator with XRE-family HTH domain
MRPDSRETTLQEVKSDLALNLRRFRLARKIAQEKLALEAGVDRTFVSKIERGLGNPSLEVLLKLANRLDINLAELLRPN